MRDGRWPGEFCRRPSCTGHNSVTGLLAGLLCGLKMLETLRGEFPEADPDHLAALGDVWSVELLEVVHRMAGITKDRGMGSLPERARPEYIFELAKLIGWLEGQIIKKKTGLTPIHEIDADAERSALKSRLTQDRIESTALVLAERVWLPLCEQWWKRYPAIPQEHSTPAKRIAPQPTDGGNRRQHYSPDFSNKHWAAAGKLRVYTLGVDGSVRSKDVRAKSWGRERFLYSQDLEHWFSLVEGDAGIPYKKLLQMIPLNEDETNRWVAYLVAQRFRTPAFIGRLLPRLGRFVIERGLNFPTDTGSLRGAYEALFSNNKVFTEMYQRLVGRRWEMWSTELNPGFIRPDEPVLVTSAAEEGWRLVYPMTPRRCFVAGPGGAESPRDVWPHHRAIDRHMLAQLNFQLAAASRRTVIARPQANDSDLRSVLASGMRQRSFQTGKSSSHEFWGSIAT